MEEFISNLIDNSSFIGGRTLAPGPVATSSRVHGPVVLAPVESSVHHTSVNDASTHSQPLTLVSENETSVPSSAASSVSILRTDMSPMIEWLTSHNGCSNDSQALSVTLDTPAFEACTSENYGKKIPKPYIELTERDCAGLVAQAIRSIVMHTCNDEFRQQCMSKLGAKNSREVEHEIKSRLHAIMEHEEQQNQSDGDENLETTVESTCSVVYNL